jgi:hypothetical protein
MVIRDFHIKGIAIPPSETNAPLIVYTDTMLTFSIPLESFQFVAGRLQQIS